MEDDLAKASSSTLWEEMVKKGEGNDFDLVVTDLEKGWN